MKDEEIGALLINYIIKVEVSARDIDEALKIYNSVTWRKLVDKFKVLLEDKYITTSEGMFYVVFEIHASTVDEVRKVTEWFENEEFEKE